MTRPEDHCAAGHCVTCSDEGLPMRVLGRGTDGLTSCLDDAGDRHEVMADLVGTLAEGDVVLVHAGVALAKLEEGVPA